MDPHLKTPARAWLVVALLCVVGCLNYLDRSMIATMRGSIVQAMPMTDAQFGLLTSVFAWVYAVVSPFAGFLADRFNRSRVIIGSLFAWSAVTWLTAHAKTYDQLLATRALMGITEACYIPAALALITDYHRGPTRSFATGVHMAGIMLGASLGGMGGWLAERHSWSYAFNLFGGMGVAYSVVLLFTLRDAPRAVTLAGEPEEKIRFGAALKNLFSSGSYLLTLAYWGLLGLVGWLVLGWLPTYLQENFHLSQGTAGLSATVYLQVASLVGVLVGGAWADRWSRTNPRGRIFVPALGLCLAAPGIFLATHTSLLPIAIAGLVIYGLTYAFSDANMMPILCLIADPRYRATGYGVLNFFGCAVGGLAVYAGGALRDGQVNLSKIFMVAGASMIVCIVLLLLLKPRPEALEESRS